VNVKKTLIIAAVALVVFYLVSDPTGAAQAVHGGLGVLKDAAEAVLVFVRTMFNG
jgi:hypothetical protein